MECLPLIRKVSEKERDMILPLRAMIWKQRQTVSPFSTFEDVAHLIS